MPARSAANASHNGDSHEKYVEKGQRDSTALRQYHADLRIDIALAVEGNR
jgi:hypothetical protein